jgi:hypothetical protein
MSFLVDVRANSLLSEKKYPDPCIKYCMPGM